MDPFPTIAELHRQTGLPRVLISNAIELNRIETTSVGAAKVVTPDGMKQLAPILEGLQKNRKPTRTYRKHAASA